ncbi:MAG: glucans biosynthesis glucosyltransferase MdoH [Alkalilacustris sp.]
MSAQEKDQGADPTAAPIAPPAVAATVAPVPTAMRRGRMPRLAPHTPPPDAPSPSPAAHAAPRRTRAVLAALTTLLAGGLIWAMARGLAPLQGADWAVLGLFALSVIWTGFAAAIALIGVVRGTAPARPAHHPVPADWRPRGRTALVLMTCGEETGPILRTVRALHRDLGRAGLAPGPDGATGVFLLSDTRGPAADTEARAFDSLADLPGVWWRQRRDNTGRKPGNMADWIGQWGGAWDHMIVLDADSRMTAERVRALIHRLEAAPDTALVQSGMRLLPARSRFGALQRLSVRLGGPAHGLGLAAWTGREGNYWGHNAALRIAPFAAHAAHLPVLPGRAPMGGAVLSHDFIEAAFLRRAGWGIEIAPDSRGSFEDGPQRLDEFHRRDRRWCQGNLQHLRFLVAPGLHPVSRLHLLCGIMGYLAAPIWLALVLTVTLARPEIGTLVPLVGGLALLCVPKLAGAARWALRAPSPARRRVVARAALGELALSTLLAPVMLLRQSLAVAAVALGRDSGWTPAGLGPVDGRSDGRLEVAAGLALGLVVLPVAGLWGAVLLTPVLGPLLAAPWILRWLEAPIPRRTGRAGTGQPATPRPTAQAA